MSSMGLAALWTAQDSKALVCQCWLYRGLRNRIANLELEDRNDSDLAAAGVGYAGTQAAAEFITNPLSISTLVKSLPKGWEKKNIQVVLHTSVTNQLPSAPDVVATYCW